VIEKNDFKEDSGLFLKKSEWLCSLKKSKRKEVEEEGCVGWPEEVFLARVDFLI